MKIAMTIAAAALLVTGCATDPVRQAAWDARDLDCRQKSWVYKDGEFVCGSYGGGGIFAGAEPRSPFLPSWYGNGNSAENTRNTPYENERMTQWLVQSTPKPKQ